MTLPEVGSGCAHCYELNRDIRIALSGADTFADSARILLTILTQRPEFGFNRAAIFVRKGEALCGFAASGADSPDDCAQLDQTRSQDLAKAISALSDSTGYPSRFEQHIRTVSLPLRATDNPLVESLRTEMPVCVSGGLSLLHPTSDSEPGIAFPLFARGHAFAVVYVDRLYGDNPPTEPEMWRVAAFGNMIDDHGESDDLWIPTVAEPVGVLAERMMTITRLAMRLAHHARNPLAVVGGFSHHLKSRMGDSEPARRALDAIVQNTARLEDLIEDIPAYALSPDTEPGPFELADVVEDGIRSLPRHCRWTLERPASKMELVSYAVIVAACVYIVTRYLATRGVVRLGESPQDTGYAVHFCAEDSVRTRGLEIMSVNQLMRMIGGSSRMEADEQGSRFVLTIPKFVHCPIVPAQGVERF